MSLKIILKQHFFFLSRHVPSSEAAEVCTINGSSNHVLSWEKNLLPPSLFPNIPFPRDFLASLTGDMAGSLPILHKLSVWQQLGHVSVQLWQSQVTVVNELLRDLGIWNTSIFVHLETQRHTGQRGEREKGQRSARVTLPCYKREFFKNGTINTEKLHCIDESKKLLIFLASEFQCQSQIFFIKFLCRFMKEMTQHSLIQKYSVTKPLLPHEGCSVTHFKQHSSHFLPLPPLLQEYSLCELFLTHKSRNVYEATSCTASAISNHSSGANTQLWDPGDSPGLDPCPNTNGSREQRDVDGNAQPGRAWSTDGGYPVHGSPVERTIRTAVQTHPAVHRPCKGLVCHY